MPKIVFGNIYVHRNYLHTLPSDEIILINTATKYLPKDYAWNLLKISKDRNSVTFSTYPNFDNKPHPELKEWLRVNLVQGNSKRGNGSKTNPLILHRKETFVDTTHPLFSKFNALSLQEIAEGLYDPRSQRFIGRKNYWEGLLRRKGLIIKDHQLIKSMTLQQSLFGSIDILDVNDTLAMSGKTAMYRSGPSLEAKMLVERKLLKGKIFDWGCGRGKDLEYFRQNGFFAEGWDPVHRPDEPPSSYVSGSFDWVHCNFVLNTLQTVQEREQALDDIYNFLPVNGNLSIAVRSKNEINRLRKGTWEQMGDGWITSRKTFQKGYEVEELVELLQKHQFRIEIILTDPVFIIARKSE